MNLRIARKILVRGRPFLPGARHWSVRLCAQERAARKVVIRHWARRAFSNLELIDALDAWCHADNRALDAQEERVKARK